MQVILDSSFARPGSAPTWGGKKGEFRDWTTVAQVRSWVTLSLSNESRSLRARAEFFYFVIGTHDFHSYQFSSRFFIQISKGIQVSI